MAKEISVYEPIGDGTKDRGEELLDDGIITEEEFEAKKQLLGL